jgi:HYR domain
MKTTCLQRRGAALGLLCAAAFGFPMHAQVILNPVTLQGTVQFNNANPVILDWLTNTASPLETLELALYAYGQPPAAATQTSIVVQTNLAGIPYSLIVDAGAGGVAYEIAPDWITGPNTGDYYYFTPQITPVLMPGGGPVTLNFTECAGVLDLRFVTSDGTPVFIQGLQAQVQRLSDSAWVAESYYGVPPGSSVTNKLLLVPGGGPYSISVTYQTGTNAYFDTLRYEAMVTNTVACDQIVVANVVVPTGPQLAQAKGNVDLVGEFPLTVPDWPLTGNPEEPGKTVIMAYEGPFNNQRWAAVRGTNFTQPASGPFVLSNLVPTSVVSPEYGYVVQAQMVVRTNRDYAYFASPSLGLGSNAGLLLASGTNADLGNLFVIQPGYLRAPILLKGPTEGSGQPSALRSLVFSADRLDPYGYGLPDGAIVSGIYGTFAQMTGADDLAPGATFAASGGYSSSGGPGAFNPATASYEGVANLPLGGLSSQPSVWKRSALNYRIEEGTAADPEHYVVMDTTINCQDTNKVTINAGEVLSNRVDFSFGMGEVRLSVLSTGSQFRNPEIYNDYNVAQFSGTNFLGGFDSYNVTMSYALGTPSYFTNQGLIVMYLPQGAYSLSPTLESLNPDGSTSTTQLQPVNFTVGVGQRISLQSDLQVQLIAPNCAGAATVPISGQVLGTNSIVSLTLSVDGGPSTNLCINCGVNPSFATTIPVNSTECADTTVTVTALDQFGHTASTTSTIHYDTVPPVITCPSDLSVGCAGPEGAVVTYNVSATDDCPGPVNLVSTPPSGSLFPVGTTTVHCTATDQCGNASQCSFKVTVAGSSLSIQPAIQIAWQCGGVLQAAPSPAGPWADVPGATSPYYTVVNAQQQYFRVRN